MGELATTLRLQALVGTPARRSSGTLAVLRRPRLAIWAALAFAGSLILAPEVQAKALGGKVAVKNVAMLDHRRSRAGSLRGLLALDDGEDGA